MVHYCLLFFLLLQVIDGFDTLDAIEKVPVGAKNRPVTDIILEKITIHANPLAK
jgi:peptidyl-prolyl cis-trans isomerase-like 3